MDYQVKVTQPYTARFGIFRLKSEECKDNKGYAYSQFGIVNPEDDNDFTFFIGEPVYRQRIIAVQTGYVESVVPNTFTKNQVATMSSTWCCQVFLGKEMWTKFMNQDPSLVDELKILADLMRRCKSGFDDDTKIYDAENLLNLKDTIIQNRPVRL